MRKGAPMESLGARTCHHPVVPKPVLNISEKQEQSLWPLHDLPEYMMFSILCPDALPSSSSPLPIQHSWWCSYLFVINI